MFPGRTLLFLGLGLSFYLTTLSKTAAGLPRPPVDFPLPVESYHDQQVPSLFGKLTARIHREPLNLAATIIFLLHFAIKAGTQAIVLDIDAKRLEFCGDQLGVLHLINASHEDPLEALKRITSGDLPTTVFDATGNPRSMMDAFQYPAHGGQLVFVGLFQGDVTFNDPNFHRRELTVSASRNALSENFITVINLLETRTIDTKPWITHRSRLNDVLKEFPRWTKSTAGVIKAMIEV
jgi:threonine dehydrogenase-like Zn-dependent dehydrogenase